MRRTISVLVLMIIIATAFYGYLQLNTEETKPLTLYGNVDIRTVDLAFRVGGRLAKLNVDEGDQVAKGMQLGELDDAPYQVRIQQAQANLQAAQASLDLLEAGYREQVIAQARERMSQAESAFLYAKRNYDRLIRLRQQNAIAQDAVDAAQDRRDQARADLASAQQQLDQYLKGNRPEQIAQGRAQVSQAQSALAAAQLDAEDTHLFAPTDGTILVRAREPGAMLNQGATVLTLALAKPMWIKAYIDEPQLGEARPGRRMLISSDSAPNKTYQGHIGFVSPTAEFTPKTVQTEELRTSLVYRLRIILDEEATLLRQGMPVTLRFKDHHESN
ncbi:secretion protein HlyD [Terasakiispira papahanaumokuakeensis]|uniref:Secretion protein HlyD n=1 Tax=Terasakiispira papahanaumokuakeensis TaxID=197479 RepID=A0A1E2V8M5_9GAMM|nr:secretion protein HlyD [Terasakiispira papahanaumokuakeensis]ODC03331.1 secretion protein HlyD [Terasakiispira papahanaumokuakeensis]